MCDFNPQSLEFDGLPPDDPDAPRRYPRDLFADTDQPEEQEAYYD